MIKKIFGFLFSPLLLTLLALIVVALLIWWIGPLVKIGSLAPLESEMTRAIVIGVIVLIVVLRALYRRWRARRASQHLTDGLMKAPAAKTDAPVNGEQKILDTRFSEAVATLKQMRLHAAGKKPGWRDWMSISGGSYLYDLPWYVFIGAPGAGKTTALVNSGLSFPLAEKFGPGAIRGVGGTRNCDWWFTDEAVLIDTAGRYTTQDSHQSEDKSAWEGFLGLLKKARPRRPLNGVFLTVSVADLLSQGPEARTQLAASIRARLLELDGKLTTRLPVYVLVTKSDLLYGFTDYFDDLGKEQRAQVFGFTLPANENVQLEEEGPFHGLQPRVRAAAQPRERWPHRAHAARDRRHAPRGHLRFSGAVRLHRLAAVRPARTRCSPVRALRSRRGCAACTSPAARRKAAPIDRVMGSLARSFGIERAVLAPQKSSGRSYFLTSLLREVVFPEQRLAGADVKLERRRHTLRVIGVTAMTLVTVGLLAAWGYSTLQNMNYLKSVEARVEPARQNLAALPARVQNLVEVAPVLQSLRDIWKTPDNHQGDEPLSMTLGLYQGDKLDAAAMLTHQRALNDAFLPQIAKRIEDQLRTAQKDNLEYTYEALKSYLMLYQPEHFDAEALKAWITLDWARNLDRGIPEDQRKALEDQLDVLIAQGPPRSPLKMDENLVRSVRAVLASYPLEQRVFSRLKRQRATKDIPAFSVATATGPSGPLVFERISGKPLTDGVPGMFTYDGYHKRFQNEVTVLTGLLANEDPWVLGQDRNAADRLRDVAALGALTDRVRRLYLEEYVKVWEALLADVRLIRATGLEKNIETARILSGVDSPLANFLRAVVKQTTLIPAADARARTSSARRPKRCATRARAWKTCSAATSAGRWPRASASRASSTTASTAAPPRHRRRTQPARAHRRCAEALQRGLRVPQRGRHGREGPHLAAARRRGRQAQVRCGPPARAGALDGREPQPVGRRAGADGGARQPEPGPAPRGRVLRARHRGPLPFVSTSKRDVLPEDFGQMFGPGGLMDDFFQKRLAALVDTSTRPWRYKPVAERGAITTQALAQFERAARIKDIFFRGGGRGPSMRLDFKPVEMDAGITQFILDVDGQLVKYAHGPVVPMAVQWPGPKGSNQVRIQVSPPSTTGSSGAAVDGPWALFRALDDGQLEAGDAPEKFFITFQIGARKTRFEVTTNSVQHPIRLRELREFSCPEGL